MKPRSQAPLKRNASGVSPEDSSPAGGGRAAPSARTASAWPIVLAAGLIVLATLVAYSNSFRCAFVFDDMSDIVNNRSIRHLWPIQDVFVEHRDDGVMVRSRPVVNLSLAVNRAMGDLDPFSYHVVNLLIHTLAGLTLFGLVRRTLVLPSLEGRFAAVATPLALAVALFWCLHPLQTEAVTYITQRYESMMAMFYLLALYAAVRSGTSEHPGGWTVAAVAATLLALGCKEVAVSIPISILLYDRAFLAGSFGKAWRQRRAMYVGLAAAWVLFGLLLWASSGRSSWAGYGLPTTWIEYARSQFGVILHYLWLTVWPSSLVLDYAWPVARTPGQIVPAAVVVLGLVAATGYALIRWPKCGFLGAGFFMILAPTSSVLPILDLSVEHRMYLPLAAVVAGAVLGGYALGRRLVAGGRISPFALQVTGYSLLLLIGAAMILRTLERNEDYRSEFAIWADTVAKAPGNPRGHYNLGLALARQGQASEAIAQYEAAVALCPTYADAHNNLGNALVNCKRVDEGIAHLEVVLKLRPDNADVYYNLGNAMVGSRRMNEAAAYYEKTLALQPDYVKAHNNLGNVLVSLGRLDEAIVHFDKVLELEPTHSKARTNRDGAVAQRARMMLDKNRASPGEAPR